MRPYVVYWTHDDGMDQHELVALLTPEQADQVEALLIERKAIDFGVTDVLANAAPFDEIVAEINEDLPPEDD